MNLNVIEDEEPDAALGNGGLGRLAACFLGFFGNVGISGVWMWNPLSVMVCLNRRLKMDYQVEVPDNWLERWQSI